MKVSAHWAAVILITVPPFQDARLPPAAIGRGRVSRCLSSLAIGRRGFAARRRAAPLVTAERKKSPPEVSINQRRVRRAEREKGRRGVEAQRDAQGDRPHPNYLPSRFDLMRSDDDSVRLEKFDAGFLVTVGITLDTW